MVALALVLWVLVTVLLAAPVAFLLRRLDNTDVEEVIDPVELQEAMDRHPSQRPKVA